MMFWKTTFASEPTSFTIFVCADPPPTVASETFNDWID